MNRFGLLLCLLLVAGCSGGFESMAWKVDRSTTVESLDRRYRDEVGALIAADGCLADHELPSLMECADYHIIWNRYWWARRSIAELQ